MAFIISEEEFKEITKAFKEFENLLSVHLKVPNAKVVSHILKAAAIFAASLKNEDKKREDQNMKIWLHIFSPSFLESLEFSMRLTDVLNAEVKRRMKIRANKKSS